MNHPGNLCADLHSSVVLPWFPAFKCMYSILNIMSAIHLACPIHIIHQGISQFSKKRLYDAYRLSYHVGWVSTSRFPPYIVVPHFLPLCAFSIEKYYAIWFPPPWESRFLFSHLAQTSLPLYSQGTQGKKRSGGTNKAECEVRAGVDGKHYFQASKRPVSINNKKF